MSNTETRRAYRLERARDTSYYRMKLTKRDWITMAIMTLIYAVLAFTVLGSMSTPITYWTSTKVGEHVTIDLGEEVTLSRINFFCGVKCDGRVGVTYSTTENGRYDTLYTTKIVNNESKKTPVGNFEADVFKIVSVDINYEEVTARYLRFTTSKRGLMLGEIAIYANGSKTPWENITIISDTFNEKGGSAEALFDEQEKMAYSYDYMNSSYFDEVYHGRTGYEHLFGIRPYEWTHPPLGKLLIAFGMAIFTPTMFGMRFMGAFFGVLLVPLMYLFGKKLTKDSFGGFAAAFLMMFDFMHFTHSRISSIDVYGVTFVLLMFYFMYDFYVSKPHNLGLMKSFGYLLCSGFFMGCAISVKWNMAYGGVGLAIVFALAIFSQMWDRKVLLDNGLGQEHQWTGKFAADYIVKMGIFCVFAFIVLPVTIYFATFIPYTMVTDGTPYKFSDIIALQESIFNYHSESVLGSTHYYQSSWYTWPVIGRPLYMYASADNVDGMRGSIVTMGNPAVWWVGAACVVMSIAIALKKRDKRLVPVIVGLLSLYLPWIFVERCTFIYHYFPVLPFVMLCTAYVLVYIKNNYKHGFKIAVAYFVVVAVLFVVFYPVLTGIRVDSDYIYNVTRWFPSWEF